MSNISTFKDTSSQSSQPTFPTVFLLGIPHCGSTLLGRILNMHSALSNLVDRFKSIGRLEDSGRVEIWATGIKMFKHSPIAGQGAGTFKEQYSNFNVDLPGRSSPARTPHAHNIYIHALAEMGVIGLGAFLYLLLSTLSTAYLSLKNATNEPFMYSVSLGLIATIAVYLLEGMLTHSIFRMWQMQKMALLFGMVIAALVNEKINPGGKIV